jgi:hypothetical protein
MNYSAADLTDALTENIQAMAYAVIASERTHRIHPTYITKRAARAEVEMLAGAQRLYFRLFPLTEVDPDHVAHSVSKLCTEAHRLAASWI